jgi:ribose transport system ATP-binding protein
VILDEPTTSLTSRETERLWAQIARLKAKGVAILYVSHTLEDVLRLSEQLLVLRDGEVTWQAPNSNVTVPDLVNAMVGRAIGSLFPDRPAPKASAPPLLELKEVGEPGVVEHISLQVGAGEIVGLFGLMGAGRSELARIAYGLDPHREGEVRVQGQALPSGDLGARRAAGMAFLTEDRRQDGLLLDASVADNLALAAWPAYSRAGDGYIRVTQIRDALARMVERLHLKSGPIQTTQVRTLSGGNQQKVVLGRWMLTKPKLFILDEPTRGVDIGAKEEIYRTLSQMAESGTGILIISSEIEELMGLCDQVLVMHQGRIQVRFAGPDFDRATLLAAAFGQEKVS